MDRMLDECKRIEMKYLKKQRQKVYIACENLDFVWDEREVHEIEHMWSKGLSIHDIARSFGRDPDEVAILIVDRARQGKIKPRKGGVLGCRQSNGI